MTPEPNRQRSTLRALALSLLVLCAQAADAQSRSTGSTSGPS